mmetsp:Transcript_38502/g.73761  ORF Transcript_38502/g.73761 Transcript_38502/m.73761 type:complete len:292 (-) Transcript_38502:77-952(-)
MRTFSSSCGSSRRAGSIRRRRRAWRPPSTLCTGSWRAGDASRTAPSSAPGRPQPLAPPPPASPGGGDSAAIVARLPHQHQPQQQGLHAGGAASGRDLSPRRVKHLCDAVAGPERTEVRLAVERLAEEGHAKSLGNVDTGGTWGRKGRWGDAAASNTVAGWQLKQQGAGHQPGGRRGPTPLKAHHLPFDPNHPQEGGCYDTVNVRASLRSQTTTQTKKLRASSAGIPNPDVFNSSASMKQYQCMATRLKPVARIQSADPAKPTNEQKDKPHRTNSAGLPEPLKQLMASMQGQ